MTALEEKDNEKQIDVNYNPIINAENLAEGVTNYFLSFTTVTFPDN